MAILHVDNQNFETEVIKSEIPVIVDFYADWCGPCKLIGPILENLSKKMSDIKICKLDVDVAPAIAQQYDVSGIPTVIMFKNGQAVNQFSGALPEAAVEKFINQNR